MFRPVAGKDNWSRVKKIVMGSLAMAATGLWVAHGLFSISRLQHEARTQRHMHCACHAERDPDFGANAARQLDKRKKVIVYCGRGGTIKTGFGNERSGKFFKDDPERAFGIETRSLKGCYELYEVTCSLGQLQCNPCGSAMLLQPSPFPLCRRGSRTWCTWRAACRSGAMRGCRWSTIEWDSVHSFANRVVCMRQPCPNTVARVI